jgi:hypothetical protein
MCAECENYLLGGACLPACPPGYYPAISRTLGQTFVFRDSHRDSQYSLGFVFFNRMCKKIVKIGSDGPSADLSKSWEISCFSSEEAMAQNTNSHEIYQFQNNFVTLLQARDAIFRSQGRSRFFSKGAIAKNASSHEIYQSVFV